MAATFETPCKNDLLCKIIRLTVVFLNYNNKNKPKHGIIRDNYNILIDLKNTWNETTF